MMDVGLAGVAGILPILVASAISDLRHLRIPNTHVLLVFCVFVACAPFILSWSELGLRLLAAGLAFACGFALFALRMFGGGDVKMMAAVFLVIPSGDAVVFLQLFSAALLTTCIGMVILQRLPAGWRPRWQSAQLQGHIPVAVAILGSVALLFLHRVLAG
jgi:prepilin peptidase CpaA